MTCFNIPFWFAVGDVRCRRMFARRQLLALTRLVRQGKWEEVRKRLELAGDVQFTRELQTAVRHALRDSDLIYTALACLEYDV